MRVLQGEGGDLLRESEDEVEVGAVEQFGVTLADPGGAGKGLALGAMAIAAGAIAEAAVAAVVALFDLGRRGQRCGSARSQTWARRWAVVREVEKRRRKASP